MRLSILFLTCSVLLTTSASHQAPQPVPTNEELPPSAERAYRVLSSRFDRGAAMGIVEFMDRYWRIAGNPGFNASIDHLRDRLHRRRRRCAGDGPG